MMNFLETLDSLLRQDERLIAEDGTIMKNKAYELGIVGDSILLKLLLNNEVTKAHFFKDVDGIKVFDSIKFGWTITSKEFLPDSYTKYKNKIGLIDNTRRNILQTNDVSLVWPYKDCILEGGQTKEEQKRDEIFYNEILAPDEVNHLMHPKVFTNSRLYTIEGDNPVSELNVDDNIIIRGNNLLALSSLYNKFSGKIKCIYIDPPYNTKSDSFQYNDTFNHSTWLTFMKNRLEIAKKLLRDDGVIFISINHVELGYLLILMDEIFGRENKLPIITLKAGTTASFRSINDCPVNVTEYVIEYRKTNKYEPYPVYQESSYTEDYSHFIENITDNPSKWKLIKITDIIHEQNGCKTWQEYKEKNGPIWKFKRFEAMANFAMNNKNQIVSLNTMQKPSNNLKEVISKSKLERNIVHEFRRDNSDPIYCYNGRTLAFFSNKYREINGESVPSEILTNLWTDISFLGIGPEGGVTLENGKKPELLIKTILELSTKEGDIVLDYHIGTGTTCAVAHKLNRRYIGIEQLDYLQNDSISRLKNVISGEQTGISSTINWQGGGSFVYCELKQLNEHYIEKVMSISTEEELIELLEKIKNSGFISYKINPSDINTASKDFNDLSIDDKRKLIIELLNKNFLYVNYCDMEDSEFEVSPEEKTFTNCFYGRS